MTPALENLHTLIQRADHSHAQQPIDKNKLYALHAHEMKCIGKSTARKPYAFGGHALRLKDLFARIFGRRAMLGAALAMAVKARNTRPHLLDWSVWRILQGQFNTAIAPSTMPFPRR